MLGNPLRIEEVKSTGGLIVKRKCTMCDEEITIDIPQPWVRGFVNWAEGEELIQNALPEMDAGDREVLVSGVCKICWASMFFYGEA